MRGGDVTRSIVLVMLAAAAIAAAATVATRFSGGTWQAEATDGASLALDMDITNGSGPCNPIDTSGGASADEPEYQIAICLTDAEAPPAAFNVDLLYDDTLDQCVPAADCVDTECLDGNPDANVGATVFSSPDLGANWDCSNMNLSPPVCDNDPETGSGHGKAFITCMSVETPTLPAGPGVSAPIAVVTFKNIAPDKSTFTLGTAAFYDEEITEIVNCPSAQCPGGIRDEVPPTSPVPTSGEATPADTPGAGDTPAPSGPAATAAAATAVAQGTPLSALTPPPEGTTTPSGKKTPSASVTARPGATAGEENEEGGGTNAAVIAAIVIGALVVVGGVGWFAYRRLRFR